MASKKNRIEVEIVAEDNASDEIKQVAKEAKKLDGQSVDVNVDSDVSKVLSAFDDVAAEAKATADAAERLGKALGPELAARADTRAIVNDLKQMGLSLDQINGNADQLGAKLRNLSDADVGGKLGSSLGTARGKMDDLAQSAGSSRSVMANMVGNSVQDLAQLGGVAGSAGVALGQMGEYMTEAAGSGDKLGKIISNFALVAGPMAALAIATQVVAAAMENASKIDAFNADEVKAFTEALKEGGDQAAKLRDRIRETGDIQFDAPKVGNAWQQTWEALFGGLESGLDVLDAAGVSFTAFTEAVTGSQADFNRLYNDIDAARQKGLITSEQENAVHQLMLDTFNNQNKAAKDYLDNQRRLALGQKDVNDAFREFKDATDPVSQMPAEFQRVADAIGHGIAPAVEDVVAIMKELGIEDQNEVLSIAADLWDKQAQMAKKAGEAVRDHAKAVQETADAQAELAVQVTETALSMDELADSIDQIEEDAFKKVFDLGNAPLDALTQTQDVAEKIREFNDWFHEPETRVNKLEQDLAAAKTKLDPTNPKEYAKQLSEVRNIQDDIVEARKKVVGLPNILDLNDPNAAEFLDKIKALRGSIQDEIAQAFTSGGADAANATALGYIDALTRITGARPADVAKILGLDQGFIVKLKVQVELDEARAELEMLEKLFSAQPGGITTQQQALITNIELALQGKKVTGQEALAFIQSQLTAFGVTIPAELAVPTSDQILRDVQTKVSSGRPVQVPFTLTQVGPGGVVSPSGTQVINQTINNPPGTPATTAAAIGIQQSRNGVRVPI